ncbi:tRNA glutamyl-Q(34) synthetase GluQRS [Pseudoalteromonas sp. J010]|uniref:tRNA glutamyl-Q(34) synthetase GluQRS n=1 Tax=Pseudoalteromonas sp. J010 TaxID=998465 RepID=UPI000F648D7C|nr:tRNA glutamyl-Q(34) synthetase GluQRS [Pseudoalteromonas sp. J010]RRS07744.1 tRNA glutamyl-Q(34) synthetase GluQRS [Pseudoalteromonas sp. J010]
MSPSLKQSGSYRGRFAPSPSGPLHFGSLVAALGSYLDAKANRGQWLVRIEDIDTPRVVSGAAENILATLEAYGLYWDEVVVYQSQRHTLYQSYLDELTSNELVYACQCTRKQIKAMGGFYNNHCRDLNLSLQGNALRLQQRSPVTEFNDKIQGAVVIPNAIAHEDYITKRRDGLFAYQLVVVVDDIEQQISHVVRGADLLAPTARQISLFQQLNQSVPEYAHLPLAVAAPGFKLSKQNHAPAIDTHHPLPTLHAALRYLNVPVGSMADYQNIDALLEHAVDVFNLYSIPKVQEIQLNSLENGEFAFRPLFSSTSI